MRMLFVESFEFFHILPKVVRHHKWACGTRIASAEKKKKTILWIISFCEWRAEVNRKSVTYYSAPRYKKILPENLMQKVIRPQSKSRDMHLATEWALLIKQLLLPPSAKFLKLNISQFANIFPLRWGWQVSGACF